MRTMEVTMEVITKMQEAHFGVAGDLDGQLRDMRIPVQWWAGHGPEPASSLGFKES